MKKTIILQTEYYCFNYRKSFNGRGRTRLRSARYLHGALRKGKEPNGH